MGRFTAQVSAKHRITFNEEYQTRCEGSPLKVDTTAANPNYFGNTPYQVTQAIWSAPMTSRLLLEAGFTYFSFKGGTTGTAPPDGIFDLISVTEQSTAIQSGDRPAVCAASELRLIAAFRPPTRTTPTRTAGAPRRRTSPGRTT